MDIIEKILYTGTVTATGGRAGHASSDDGLLDIDLARPGSGLATNPEQLLAAGWSACFQGALAFVGREAGIDTSKSLVTAQVTLGNDGGGGFALSAKIAVMIPEADLDVVQGLADAAHKVCPYSRATRGNIAVLVTATASN